MRQAVRASLPLPVVVGGGGSGSGSGSGELGDEAVAGALGGAAEEGARPEGGQVVDGLRDVDHRGEGVLRDKAHRRAVPGTGQEGVGEGVGGRGGEEREWERGEGVLRDMADRRAVPGTGRELTMREGSGWGGSGSEERERSRGRDRER